jgi:predicted metal-dependent HD superfamily phosphohydrolase
VERHPKHLLPAFVDTCGEAGARAPVTDIEGAGMDLLQRYSAAERGYHDIEHLTEVLAALEELDCHAPEVRLAAWFHDAVYDGAPGRDEELSAALAVRVLSALDAPSQTAQRVHDLVLVTADHFPDEGDLEAALLCDADLAILAAGPDRYARYVAGVRKEYGHLDDDTFAHGRAAVLEALLGRTHLFATAEGRERWERRARENAAAELRHLKAVESDG